ncbi:unnamed protein product [Caenorhabditis nigoni]
MITRLLCYLLLSSLSCYDLTCYIHSIYAGLLFTCILPGYVLIFYSFISDVIGGTEIFAITAHVAFPSLVFYESFQTDGIEIYPTCNYYNTTDD